MQKTRFVIIKIFLCVVLLTSLAKATEIKGNMVISADGTFKIPLKQYSRIISLDLASIENFYFLGYLDKIVAIATSRGGVYPEEKTSKMKSVGSFSKPSFEQILAYKPDLVIIGASNYKLGLELQKLGISVINFDVNGFDDIFKNVEILSKLTNTEATAKKIIAEKKSQIAKINKEPLNHLKGAFLYSLNPLMVYSKGTMAADIMDLFGVVNIAPITTGSQAIVSLEFILKTNPDFLIVTGEIKQVDKVMKAYPHLASITAAKNNNIIAIHPMRITIGSLNVFNTIEQLHKDLKNIKIAK